MTKRFIRVLSVGLLLSLLVHLAYAEEKASALRWEKLDDLPRGVFLAAASITGRQAVLTGGVEQSGQTSVAVQVLDLDKKTWLPPSPKPLMLGTSRSGHAQVTLADGRIFVAGGMTGRLPAALQPLGSCEIIDVRTGSVEAGPKLPNPAGGPVALLLPDGKVIVIDGGAASVLDPATLKWKQHIQLRESRQDHAAAVLKDGRVLVAGGVNRRTLELIDPATGVSRQLRDQLPFGNDDLRMLTLPDGRLWVLGGQNSRGGDTTDATWLIDLSKPSGQRVSDGPALGIKAGIADAFTGVIGPWAIIGGGESQQGGHDTELSLARLLDLRTLGVWSLPVISEPHDDAAAVVSDRCLIVLGGYRVGAIALGNARVQGLPDVPVASATVEMLELPAAALTGPPPSLPARKPRMDQQ